MRTTHPRRAAARRPLRGADSACARGGRCRAVDTGLAAAASSSTAAPIVRIEGGVVRGASRFRRVRVPRAAVRRSPDREPALASPTRLQPQWNGVRDATQFAPSCPQPSEPVRAARPLLRGLPVPQRLHADAAPRREPAGARVDPRRWFHRGWRPQLRRLQARGGRHRRGHDQLPPRRARVPRPSGARVAARWPGRQLRPDGPDRRAALGQAQHRTVRRGPAQRHDRRAVGRRRVGARPAGLASLAWAVPAGDRAERRVRTDPAAARCRRGRRRGVRHRSRLSRPDRPMPANASGRCS